MSHRLQVVRRGRFTHGISFALSRSKKIKYDPFIHQWLILSAAHGAVGLARVPEAERPARSMSTYPQLQVRFEIIGEPYDTVTIFLHEDSLATIERQLQRYSPEYTVETG